ncbi:AraC family transcriptional regulator [Agrobacterium tumefaciens]|uniref:AraC family transcriptional regulator n=1 Tax=Agrobacterium tumefaciens TaxID=358 RepID=UPI00287CE77F|nr:AraC family transcriptional regulator [Agrobacterium tumefaciens]MDS7595442.1 AraC family transcriptional regulator [Agrobacterium tumefaciens]
MQYGAYGLELARRFNIDDAPFMRTSTLKSEQLAATRVTTGSRGSGLTDYIPVEKAYIVTVRLEGISKFETFQAGKLMWSGSCPAGTMSIMNLQDEPQLHLPTFYDCVKFYIPEIVFSELAQANHMKPISELRFSPSIADPAMHTFAKVLSPLFGEPVSDRSLFFDHVAVAAYMHLARTYGGGDRPIAPPGVLADWQLRRATELLASSVEDSVTIQQLAETCELPVERFLRAFKKTTGLPPHRWLREYKVKKATSLLRESPLSISEIAYACGFSDQAHMTRLFVAMTGATPGSVRQSSR